MIFNDFYSIYSNFIVFYYYRKNIRDLNGITFFLTSAETRAHTGSATPRPSPPSSSSASFRTRTPP